jgi:hypothetical protein
MKKLSITLIAVFLGLYVYAQEEDQQEDKKKGKLAVEAQVRPRAELRNGAFTLRQEGEESAFFVSQRSRLTAVYTYDKISVGLSAQNVRVWGQSGQITRNDGDLTTFNEAWAAYQFDEATSIKIGRQALSYDDQRILGALDWHQAGRWHDVALFRYEPESFTLHAAAGVSQDNENVLGNFYREPGGNYKNMQMLWFEKPLSESYRFSLLLLNTGFEVASDSSTSYMQTMGGNFYKTGDLLDLTATFYYQAGENTVGQDVNALLASLYGSYQLTQKFFLLGGVDYVSGESMIDGGADDSQAFNPLYGTHHKFYGLMDYFYVGNPHGNVGLFDQFLGLAFAPSPQLKFQLTGHHFNAAAELAGEAGNPTADLGTELDFTFLWKAEEYLTIVGGYSQMFATENMETIKGGENDVVNNWAWLMFNFRPVIYQN